MASELDFATELTQRATEFAINSHRNRPADTPRIKNGTRYCIDCSAVITQERIDAHPEASRCIACQEVRERYG